MNLEIRKANEHDKKEVLALGKKIVDVYERTHLGDDISNIQWSVIDLHIVNTFIKKMLCDKV